MRTVKYSDVRDYIKSGDRMEFASHGFVGWAIRLFTRKIVNHTAMCLSIMEFSPDPPHQKFLLEADFPRVELNPISRDLDNYTGKVYFTPLIATDAQRQTMADWALQQAGKKYDLKNLFKNAIARVNANAADLFCSELYFIALVAAGKIIGAELRGDSVVDHNGLPIKAPVPGGFDIYNIWGETVQVVWG